jgi:hypothetical protein
LVKSEVESQLCGKTEGYKKHLEKMIKQYIDDNIHHTIHNACEVKIVVPENKTDYYPNNCGAVWSVLEDVELRDAFTKFLDKQARVHRRTANAIYCRLRDKVYEFENSK